MRFHGVFGTVCKMVNQNQRSDEISHVKRENEMYPKFLDEPDPTVILKNKINK